MRLLSAHTATLLFLLAIPHAISQSHPAKPGSDDDFMQRSRTDLIASLHLRPLGDSTQTERDIATIVRALPLGLPRVPDVWVCEGCGTSSHPDVGIIVDPSQLDQIRLQSGVQNFQGMLTFVIAHEAAHQVQFARYDRNLYKLPSADREYYEAQADILAGMYLYKSEVSASNRDQTLGDALRVVYDLGGEEYALADHPSKTGRFLAARTGMQYAFTHSPPAEVPDAAQKAQKVREQIDYHPGDDDLSFSLRTARRIVQYNPVATKDLLLIAKETKLNWDKSPDHPFMTYELQYTNRGAKALRVALQVQSVAVPRDRPDDLFDTLQSASNYHTFVINPGKTTVVSGQLRWYATKDLEPSVIFPPNPLGLIEVRYADGTDKSADDGASNGLGFVEVPTGERNNLRYIFAKFVRASRNGFADLRGGPGKAYEDFTSCPSNTPLPTSVRDDVMLPTLPTSDGSYVYSLRSVLVRTLDASEASKKFDATVELVRSALASVSVPDGSGAWKEKNHSNDAVRYVTWSQDDFFVTVRVYVDKEETGLGNEPTYSSVQVRFTYVEDKPQVP
jgi:hypothetical protein